MKVDKIPDCSCNNGMCALGCCITHSAYYNIKKVGLIQWNRYIRDPGFKPLFCILHGKYVGVLNNEDFIIREI
jgi:hypothetical protein